TERTALRPRRDRTAKPLRAGARACLWLRHVSAGSAAEVIPAGNVPSLHHLAMDPAIGVAAAMQQRLRDREIANTGIGTDVGRRTAHDGLDDLEPRARADRDLLPDEIKLVPRRPARHVDIAAKTQRMDGSADRAFDRGDRGEVDDRDHLARDVGEAEAG